MAKRENKEQGLSYVMLSEAELRQVSGGQSLTQPASVSGTLGQTVEIEGYTCPICNTYLKGSEEEIAAHKASCLAKNKAVLGSIFLK